MTDDQTIFNVALVGGGDFCEDVLRKTTSNFSQEDIQARFCAVVDPDRQAPGMVLARKLGLKTFSDYRELFDPRHGIGLIIVTVPGDSFFVDILRARPEHIRLLAYDVFLMMWRAITVEEERLRKRNKEFEMIFNGIQDFLLVISPDMTIDDVNQSFLDQMGYTADEVIGRKCYEVFQAANRGCKGKAVECPLYESVRTKAVTTRLMTRVNRQMKIRYIEVAIHPIFEKDGRISKFIEISRDITERRKEEEEITRRLEKMVEDRTRQLRETHAKLIHQDKMASLGKLSASVVHEINNPIAGILNLILLIKRIFTEDGVGGENLDQFSEYLALMETETRRVSRIVSNLLAFSRQAKIEFNPVDIPRLVEKTLIINQNLLKINGIRVEKKLAQDLPRPVGSEDQLQQVFMNIVSNAAEAMEATPEAVLTIEAARTNDDGKVRILFKDNGVGIPEENLSHLFEPFFTTKKKGKGVGLGLSVAYGIIEEHGGQISVASRPGKGTTFVIDLPVSGKTEDGG